MNNISIKELFKQAQNGDKEARDYLIESNMKLVYMIAKKYLGTDYYDSLVQEGAIGLIKSVDGFEIEREIQFSTYAFYKIKGEMQRFIRDKREDIPFRVKREDFKLYGEIRNAKKLYQEKFNREPTLLEIAKYMDTNIQQINGAINAIENFTSLDNTKYHNKDGEADILIINSIENQNSTSEEQIINKISINAALDQLTEKQKKVIQLRYFQDYSQTETGQALNISQAQISRIEKKALKLLKEVI